MIYTELTRSYKQNIHKQVKFEYEEMNMSIESLSQKFNLTEQNVRNILLGKYKEGKSDLYIKNSHSPLSKQRELDLLNDYNNYVSILEILEKYNITRKRFNYIRQKHNIPDRFGKRCVDLKSITLEYNGQIKTYPSKDQAAKQTGIPIDFITRLNSAKTFAIGKHLNTDIAIVHDLNRLNKLESACELMGMILNEGSTSDKLKWGKELETLILELGYINELEYKTL